MSAPDPAALQRRIAELEALLAQEHEHLAESHERIRRALADLEAVRAHLGDARRELQWLRRAGIDLNRIMDHRLVGAARAAGRIARAPVRRLRGRRPHAAQAAAGVAEPQPIAPAAAPDPAPAATPAAPAPPPSAAAPSTSSRGRMIPATPGRHVYTAITEVLAGAVTPLAPVPAGLPDGPLRLALVVPHFAFGSGGHQVVFQLGHQLELLGHEVSYWVHDPFDERPGATGDTLRAAIVDAYAPITGPVREGFAQWSGADVAIATGWQTVYPILQLAGCRARAYLVNDHEPEFYPTSLESLFAARTYELGLPCIAGGGPWLADLLTARYGADVVATFPYPVAPEFRRRQTPRRQDTIVVYARNLTPRRAVGLALIAMEELKRRRPELRIVLFGDEDVPALNFPYEHLGPIAPEALSWVYSEATIGLAFSLTHGSLVPHDMMSCGLPVVDLAGYGTGAEHRDSGLVELAPPDPAAIADHVERLLDDPELRAERARAGLEYVAGHTRTAGAARVEAGLRTILRTRAA